MSVDQMRRLRLLRVLELFPGWPVEYAERMMEERPLLISDRFALEKARSDYHEHQQKKAEQKAKMRKR